MSGLAQHGFHAGELAVQAEVGVSAEAARLEGMLAPAELGLGAARFLLGQTFAAITARDRAGRLWTSPLLGAPGFLDVSGPTGLVVHAAPLRGDPLHDLAPGQPVGLIALDYAHRRRLRLNGVLATATSDGLGIEVHEAYGNCPQHIPPRELLAVAGAPVPPLRIDPAEIVARADTFILGTTHPSRGNDASHRGGPPGFVRLEGDRLWWPDSPGNNMFNSLGNLREDPEAAALFLDVTTRTALHLHGVAELHVIPVGAPGDDGHTGRRVVMTIQDTVQSRLGLGTVAQEVDH